jgi:hypothetical protein
MFTLRFFPFRAHIEPAHRNAILPLPPKLLSALERGELRYYDDLSFVLSLGLALCSTLVALFGAALILGLFPAAHSLVEGVRDYVDGALHPLSRAPRLLDEAFARYRGSSSASVFGHALAICGGIDFLWMPSNVMFLLALSSKSGFWPRVRFLVWVAARMTEIAWCLGFVVWTAS